jgi:hypothetical protein
MLGIGRETARAKISPFCNILNKIPASIRAEAEKGEVFTEPLMSQTTSLFSPWDSIN